MVDALLVVLNERGCVDIDAIAAKMGELMEPTETAFIVSNIALAIGRLDSPELEAEMLDAFNWWTFAQNHPDMTTEEIASAAADGFAV